MMNSPNRKSNNEEEEQQQQEDEVLWIEDADDSDEEPGSDFFSETSHDEFQMRFGEIPMRLTGIKARYPHLLQSTGMTLWQGSEELCRYLYRHSHVVKDKSVLELGAGVGVCGILAHKLGARKVVLTDGDTDTLKNMRDNVASNVKDAQNDSVLCKQLLWAKNTDSFRERFAPGDGFDVVMGGDVVYAQESLEPLFKTVSSLLSRKEGAAFVLSYVFRHGVTTHETIACAASNGFHLSASPQVRNGVYLFSRIS